jgi:hypothetical protein
MSEMSEQRALAVIPPALVVVAHDPFAVLTSAHFQPVAADATLATLVPDKPGLWTLQVNGEWISREHWHYAPPPGAVVIVRDEAAGGGGGGSDPLRLLLMIAVAVVAPYLTTALVGINGAAVLGSLGVKLVTAGIVMAGSALVNALIPIDASNTPSSGGPQQFSAQVQQNISRLGQPVPEIFGFFNGFPTLAALPYNLYDGNEQYLHALLTLGEGEHEIEGVFFGDTPLESFAEAQIVRVGTGQATRAGPGSGVETLAELTLVDQRMWTCPDVSGVDLKSGDPAGPYIACPAEQHGNAIGIDVLLPRGLDDGKSIAWRVELQAVNDFDQPTGAWSTLASETYSTKSVVPLRLSFHYAVTPGRYRVRVTRTDVRSTDDGSAHDLSWLALRSVVVGREITQAGDTLIAVKIRVSGQLSGALRFRVRHLRLLPTWDGSAWTAAQTTRSIAWAWARVLKARGVADDAIDLDGALTLDAVWAARQDRFDYQFVAQSTTWDALSLIARVGRAVTVQRAGRYTLVRDAKETAPLAHFGMRNIRRDSWRMQMGLPSHEPMQALDLEYDDFRRPGGAVVTAQYHGGVVHGYRGDANRPVGVPEPDPHRRGRIKMPGVIGEQQALRTAAYMVADTVYRPIVAEFGAELDAWLVPPLALVTLQHDVGDFSQGGDVASWDAGTLTLETTEPLAWDPAANHYLRLMRPNGTLTPLIACAQGVDAHHAVLENAPDFTPLFDDAGRERTRYHFGTAATVDALARVMSIAPEEGDGTALRAKLEDDRVHTADNAWLPADEQDPLPPLVPVDPDAGGVPLVNLTTRTLSDGGYSPFEGAAPGIEFALLADGRLRVTRLGPAGTVSYIAAEWITPQTVTDLVTGLYEISVATPSISGSPGYPEFFSVLGTYGTWLGGETSPAWSIQILAGGSDIDSFASFVVQIRDKATTTVQGSATLYVHMQTGAGGA